MGSVEGYLQRENHKFTAMSVDNLASIQHICPLLSVKKNGSDYREPKVEEDKRHENYSWEDDWLHLRNKRDSSTIFTRLFASVL